MPISVDKHMVNRLFINATGQRIVDYLNEIGKTRINLTWHEGMMTIFIKKLSAQASQWQKYENRIDDISLFEVVLLNDW